MILRDYQQAAVEAVYQALRDRDDNPCVVAPTGSGKSFLIAQICHDAVQQWQGRVLVLAHVRELLEQNADKIRQLDSTLDIGVYSAGLKSRDTENAVLVASIQSVYQRACELGLFDLIIVDEAHTLPPDGEGRYRAFLADMKVVNPRVRVIGFTATPYRMKSGLICAPENILNHVCYEIHIRELIRDGFLCPLVTKAGRAKVDTSGLQVRSGEFVAGETEKLMDTTELVDAACAEIAEKTSDRKSVLVFASGVSHGKHLAEVLHAKTGMEVGMVFGNTPAIERDKTLEEFRQGRLKYVVNVNVLTTGFDAPNIDCVAMVRPTLSPGLYAQAVGRAFRVHPGKTDALILDFGGNILRHGPVDDIRIRGPQTGGKGAAPAKECPECQAVIAAGYSNCPYCGFAFPPPERQPHEARASTAGILSGQVTTTEHEVLAVAYSVHQKRGAPEDAPKTLRVDYKIGIYRFQSEWICLEHTGWARERATAWWRLRSETDPPKNVADAVDLAYAGALAETKAITIRRMDGEKYDRIVGYVLGDKPAGWNPLKSLPASVEAEYPLDEIPF